MLVANFPMETSRVESTDIRLRLSNLEAQSLAWSVDFVITASPDQRDPAMHLAAIGDRPDLGLGLDLLATPQFAETSWRRSGEVWVKTVTFTVRSGATRSVGLHWSYPYPANAFGALRYEGYAVLRLPQRRDPRRLMRFIAQRDSPARVLIAAEAILTQQEWPPHEQRIVGYAPPASLIDMGPRAPVYGPSIRPYSQIVHPLALAAGRSEMEIPPEGVRLVEAIEAERTGAALVDRLERGEAVKSADGFDQVDRLALFLDELGSLGENAGSIAAMNALLAQHGSPLLLTSPGNEPRPRPKRKPRR